MAHSSKFERGDRVIHPRRLEWGEGVVDQAAPITHEGKPAQRLVVTFANHGRVTLNTAVAALVARDATTIMSTVRTVPAIPIVRTTSQRGWLDKLERNGASDHEELWRLPEPLTDPFSSLANRLEATLAMYAHDPRHPRALLDWAIAQTGMKDPLSKYTRHELELAFPRFARARDGHLAQLVRQLKTQGKMETVGQALRNAKTPAAREALHKAVRG